MVECKELILLGDWPQEEKKILSPSEPIRGVIKTNEDFKPYFFPRFIPFERFFSLGSHRLTCSVFRPSESFDWPMIYYLRLTIPVWLQNFSCSLALIIKMTELLKRVTNPNITLSHISRFIHELKRQWVMRGNNIKAKLWGKRDWMKNQDRKIDGWAKNGCVWVS